MCSDRPNQEIVPMSAAADITDTIVASAVEGSATAVECVARIMDQRIRLMVYARLNPTASQHGLIDEISQQSMEALLQGLPTLENRSVGGLRAFASTIVARRVADYLRDPAGVGRNRERPRSLDSTFADQSTAGPIWQFLSATMTSPLSHAHREEQFRRAMAELGRLRTEYRAVITMAFFDQLTTSQIAERMGTSRQAAAMTLLRAVRTLRQRLTGSEETGSGVPSDC